MKRLKNTSKELVRDGYLGDLPVEIQSKVMAISKLVADNCYATIKEKTYNDIRDKGWAKTMLSEFLTTPKDKAHEGSVRVYKKGNRYSCMIQLTGHPVNNRNSIEEELFHDFIRNVHSDIRAEVRRKYDMHLTCESEHGEHFEGFDVWTNKKVAKEIWDKFSAMKSKTVSDYEESVEPEGHANVLVAGFSDLPIGLVHVITEAVDGTTTALIEFKEANKLDFIDRPFDTTGMNVYGHTVIEENADGFTGIICVTDAIPHFVQSEYEEKAFQFICNKYAPVFEEANPGKKLVVYGSNPYGFEIVLESNYAKYILEYIEADNTGDDELVCTESYEYLEKHGIDYLTDCNEAAGEDLSEADARKTLKALAQDIIENTKNNPMYKITQYKADTIANVITKSVLPKIGNGYRKLTIQLDSYQSFFTLEFKTPSISQDFVARFVDGRESIDGFLHRNPEIKIKMSPRILHTMKEPDDLYKFFRAAIKYYVEGASANANQIMKSAGKMSVELKRLVTTSKLSGIVSIPLSMIFTFDDVQMNNVDCFKIDKAKLTAIDQFIRSIYKNYASPEKEKSKIINDLSELIESFNERYEAKIPYTFAETVRDFYEGVYADQLNNFKAEFESAQIDKDWPTNAIDPKVRVMTEAKHMKKLKKIPVDLVAYITIEAEAIKDANDKMMIASYCLSKLEIVEWYIELLEVGSERYLVPHTKPYLQNIRTQLLACYKKIMDTKIVPQSQRPLIDIKYPAGYEG